MEYDYVYYGLLFSIAANIFLLFRIRGMKMREKYILKATKEILEVSEVFSKELQELKNKAEEVWCLF